MRFFQSARQCVLTRYVALVFGGFAFGATLGNTALGYPDASFQGLGKMGSNGTFISLANGVSADGSVVVGYGPSGSDGPNEAFRWTESTGMVGLGDILGGGLYSEGDAVSANGLVVVGRGSGPLSGTEAYRWTEANGMLSLGVLPGAMSSESFAVSADGSVIAGGHGLSINGWEAWRWTQESGLVGLGDLPGGDFLSFASGISADGSVIVGRSLSGSGIVSLDGLEAFRWTEATGMVGLGFLPGGHPYSSATAVSEDGIVVVGIGSSAASEESHGFEAFRWTESEGMVGLGDLPGAFFTSRAFDVSANGAVIVGDSNSDSGLEAMIWDAGNGMRSIRDLLVDGFGLDLTGWSLTRATGVSADGRTIVGYGTNPDGNTEAWRIVLGCLPCQQHGDVFPRGDYPGNCVVDLDDLMYELGAFSDPDPCANFPDSNLFPCSGACLRGTTGAVDIDDIMSSLAAFGGTSDCLSPCGS